MSIKTRWHRNSVAHCLVSQTGEGQQGGQDNEGSFVVEVGSEVWLGV